MTRVGFALFGLGNMGLSHVKNIMMSPRATVNWIIRNKIEDAEKFVSDHGLQAKCTTPDKLEAVYNDSSVGAVLVCSPTTTHETIIRDSLNAEKAVFCEKPITDNINTTEDCYNLAASKNKLLFNALHRRFDPDFHQVYSKIQGKNLGNLRIIKTTSRDLEAPPISYIKTSGGILNDSTIHDLDLSLWLSGSIPQSIYVQGSAFDPEIGKFNDMDQVVVTIKFENGVIACVENGRVAGYGYDQRLEALFDKGMVCVNNPSSSNITEFTGTTTSSGLIQDHFTVRYQQAYANELEHFLDALQGKCELRVTKEDTLKVMKLVQACQKSVQTQGPVGFD